MSKINVYSGDESKRGSVSRRVKLVDEKRHRTTDESAIEIAKRMIEERRKKRGD
ncbi:hypothetical protein [Bradyrhizobium sp. 15]|uniref:hypothetical protein n=1 Tax=Bradyrhizobium sp. 15 TaxID=2782633 RepID=UPI001FF76C4F|nr:hypothetical protein [Bradyrhizobium sp. 15]MCK1437400.1 hypothetical protein [Bradyrhizobium sp. 15]